MKIFGKCAALAAVLAVGSCSAGSHAAPTWVGGRPVTSTSPAPATSRPSSLLPGMPAPLVADDLYAADRPGALSPVVRRDRQLVYVPNLGSNTVSVIDPHTYRIVRTVPVGKGPQHVVPSWDLKTLWVNNDTGNSLTPIDPVTGTFGKAVPVEDPYNLYSPPARSSRSGRSPAAPAPTWAESPPTARCSGSPAATTRRSTRSTPPAGACSPGSRSAASRVWPQPGRYSLGHTGILR